MARGRLPRRHAARSRSNESQRGPGDGTGTPFDGTGAGTDRHRHRAAHGCARTAGPALESPPPASPPPALVTLARKVADEHRARTGTDIDTSTLRARLGVPMPLAEAIATQLT